MIAQECLQGRVFVLGEILLDEARKELGFDEAQHKTIIRHRRILSSTDIRGRCCHLPGLRGYAARLQPEQGGRDSHRPAHQDHEDLLRRDAVGAATALNAGLNRFGNLEVTADLSSEKLVDFSMPGDYRCLLR